jgi:hypothetical protein
MKGGRKRVCQFIGQRRRLNRHDAKTPRWKMRLGMILPWRLGVMAVQFLLSRKFWHTRENGYG